ncbi:MAG: hypothetical protein IKL73_03215 [Lachnospiraceae bacterium]|nr:hypothetical protein [Lachnospiraceae bacterium]
MKKIFIPFTILTALLIIGVLSFKFYTGHETTISITSEDGKTTWVLGRYKCISYDKSMAVSRFGGQEIVVEDIEDFMDKTVFNGTAQAAYYKDAYSEMYLRAYDGHCFKVEVSAGRIYLSESICYVSDPVWDDDYYFISPLKVETSINYNKKTTATWEETKGFINIRELAEFYETIDDNSCEVDKENNIIRLRLKNTNENAEKKEIIFLIKATDEGIEMYREGLYETD